MDQFLKRHTRFTEQDKIDYLLSSTRISGAKFVRNGNQYDGSSAAKFLRWKMLHKQYRNSPIRTADDFVNRVAVRSNKTGRPYEIILPDGRREKTVDVFRSELEALEKALLKNQSLQILPHNSQVKQSNHAGTIVHVAAFKSK
ncbi:MAG: DUF5329 family protein [Candidatus Omnitrophica bacterium]|nr:DUF5329 family protein [Candidatus Omnitrophota bacterium]